MFLNSALFLIGRVSIVFRTILIEFYDINLIVLKTFIKLGQKNLIIGKFIYKILYDDSILGIN